MVHVLKKVMPKWQQGSREQSNHLMRTGYFQGCIIQGGVIHIDQNVNDAPCVCASK